jgi:hypothetical protein
MRHRVIAILLLSLPSLAAAQGFPGKLRLPGRQQGAALGDSARTPVQLFIDERERMNLSDGQVQQLMQLRIRLRERNDSLREGIDSLRAQLQPPANGYGTMTPEQWQHMRVKRTALAQYLAAQRDAEQSATTSALALLDADQQGRGKLLIAQEEQRQADLAREKADSGKAASDKNGGRGGGGGRRRPGGIE